jgi:error-prone DNA polymerase
VFEKFRRAILASSMLGCRGKVQREGEVIHVIAEHLVDLSGELSRVSELDQPFRWPAGRGDGARQTGGRIPASGGTLRRKPRDIYVPDLRTETLEVKARDFR